MACSKESFTSNAVIKVDNRNKRLYKNSQPTSRDYDALKTLCDELTGTYLYANKNKNCLRAFNLKMWQSVHMLHLSKSEIYEG